MNARIGFYHLQKTSLEQALPKLLEKVLDSGQRAVVMAGSAERVAFFDSMLWTFAPDSWLPHGTARDGDAERQPIFLTDKDENPNQATVLLLTDGVVSEQIDRFERCLLLFDGNDETAVAASRDLWKKWKERGFLLTYFQQTERGGWLEKATANGPNDAGGGRGAGSDKTDGAPAGGEAC